MKKKNTAQKLRRKKTFKIFTLTFLITALILSLAAAYVVADAYSPRNMVAFDKGKLDMLKQSVEFYDGGGDKIAEPYYGNRRIDIALLPPYVPKAFVCVEDKRFYTHNGIDYRRIIGATLNNIKNKNSIQGASTISQQVIKNTHLSGDRTIKRKLQEIKLTKTLEKNYSKDEILEMYLNTIYFGNKAYGIENAAQTYFKKTARELSIAEGATLAAIIRGPAVYSPNVNLEKCLTRRNYILKLMKDDGVISADEWQGAVGSVIDTDLICKSADRKGYFDSVVSEACRILNVDQAEFFGGSLKIYTYLDSSLQAIAQRGLNAEKYNPKNQAGNICDRSIIILDNKSGGVAAFCGRSRENLYTLKRQPGSCIKPALVFAPALEENIINPLTPILDQKIDFGGYAPKNYNDKYYGWVTAKRALEMSLNSPAASLLNMVGVEKAKSFARKNGIGFDKRDDSLALSLGGFTYGLSVAELANSYMTFANGGQNKDAKFIKKIVDQNGAVLFSNDKKPVAAMRPDTAYLMTTMLVGAAKNGTASRLKALDYDVAAKTGTVGYCGGNDAECGVKNSDAWLMSFSSEHTVGIWYGNTGGEDFLLDKSLTGGALPAELCLDIYNQIYKTHKPADFKIPDGVEKIDIDLLALNERHKIELAALNTPDKFRQSAFFSVCNKPDKVSDSFSNPPAPKIELEIKNKIPVIKFDAKNYYGYKIIRKSDDKELEICSIKNKDGRQSFKDKKASTGKAYEYYLIAFVSDRSGGAAGQKSKSVYAIIPYDLTPKKDEGSNEKIKMPALNENIFCRGALLAKKLKYFQAAHRFRL
jgi:membrane peptidoglycan carboxypeptidase